MSKLARDRKKHWRYILAIAKEQNLDIGIPRKYKRRRKVAFDPNILNSFYLASKHNIVANLMAPSPFLSMLTNKLRNSAAGLKNSFSSIYFHPKSNVDDELRGRSINQVWVDELNDEVNGGEVIQEAIDYGDIDVKDKSKE